MSKLDINSELLAGVLEVERARARRAGKIEGTMEMIPDIREVEAGRVIEPDEPFVLACNRCNHERPPSVHPCPECRCPEYRILPPR